MMHKHLPVSLALALAAPWAAQAQTPPSPTTADLRALQQEIQALRASYETRLEALEQRLKAAEAQAAAVPPPSPSPSPAPMGAPIPTAAVSAPAVAGPGESAFNPALSLILSGLYTRTSQDPASYAISGARLPAGAEIGPGTRGLSLAESELGLAANIDPWLRGVAHIALHPDDAVSVEEAYVQTLGLGGGATLKAGRFLSGIGYLNAQHAHTWDFVDNPLAYQALLGTQYGDDGVQLTWLAPTDRFVELGAELGRGRTYPGDGNGRNGAGMTALTAHTGGDVGISHSWRAGVSVLNAKAGDQRLSGAATDGSSLESSFSGRTRVWVADALWKWAPDGQATRTNFKLQGEYLRSTRSGSFVPDVAAGGPADAYRVVQSGGYLQAVYQFMPRWRVGLRTERLQGGATDGGDAGEGLHRPSKHTLMVDFNPSEFSRLRLQLAEDRARPGPADRQLFLQYQMSLGAHGAHGY